MSVIVFFLPDVEESEKLKVLIEAHGGRCIDQFECNSYQIRTASKTEIDFDKFYLGPVYDEAWIKDCISLNHLQQMDEYKVSCNDSDYALKLNIGNGKRLTIVEGMRLYKQMGARSLEKVPDEYFKGIERQRIFPERSAETIKNFWKEY